MASYRLRNGRLSRTTLACNQLEDRVTPAVLDLTASVGSAGSFGPNGYTGLGVHEGTINNALFQQSLSNTSTGTGIFPAFVRIQHNGTERGYNYDAAGGINPQFDEHTDAPHNRLIQLGDVPVVTISGIAYRTFRLDLKESDGQTNELLSLDELRIFLTASSPVQNAYTDATNKITTADGAFAPIYDLDNPAGVDNPNTVEDESDNWILLDSTLSAGNGKGDMLALIPNSLFTGANSQYVTLYSRFGLHGSSVPGADTSASFEEWSYLTLDDGSGGLTSIVTLEGQKFQDHNGNGVQDPGDGGIAGWHISVWLDSNGDGVKTTDETRDIVTDAGGGWTYSEAVLNSVLADDGSVDGADGADWSASEVNQPGWTQTFGNAGYSGTFTAEDTVPGLDFGNFDNIDISGVKFYDFDADGVRDAGEPGINGWTFGIDTNGDTVPDVFATTAGDSAATGGTFSFTNLGPGTYTVYELNGLTGMWVATTSTTAGPFTASSGINVTTHDFGNIKLAATGGFTLGFWSNPNGKAILQANEGAWRTLLNGLNLRNANGTDFDVPTTGSFANAYAAFRTWILNATATNMSYMLSAQLAATTLDIAYKGLSASTLVYLPGLYGWTSNAQGSSLLTNLYTSGMWTTTGSNVVPLSEVIANANTLLGTNGSIPAGDGLRLYGEALKIVLDGTNNNLNIAFFGLGSWTDTNGNGVIDPGEGFGD